MQGGVHLLAGLILALFTKNPYRRFGIVFGSILPDGDWGPLIFALLLGDKSRETVSAWHRTYSHCLLLVALLPLTIIAIGALRRCKHTFHQYWSFASGLFVGLLSHIGLDLIYLAGVRLHWPFDHYEHQYLLIKLEHFDDFQLKLIQATDHLTDLFFYIPIFHIAKKYHVNQKAYNFLVKHVYVEMAFVALFVGLAFVDLKQSGFDPIPELDELETYMMLLFVPAAYFICVSVAAPILLREAVMRWEWSEFVSLCRSTWKTAPKFKVV